MGNCSSCLAWRKLLHVCTQQQRDMLFEAAKRRKLVPTNERLDRELPDGSRIPVNLANRDALLLFLGFNPKEWKSGRQVHMELDGVFDRVVCINLPRRKDRRQEMEEELDGGEWPFGPVEWVDGTDGHVVPAPHGWRSGGGAWGCMQSHRRVLESAIQDGVKSILVLEDDASLNTGFAEKVQQFLKRVPSDWDGLMLGGQHIATPSRVGEGIVKCHNCQRTHAYAVRGEYMRALYQEWVSRSGHCDHIMGPMHSKWKVYAPDPFLVAQREGKSDISGNLDKRRLWSSRADVPCILLKWEGEWAPDQQRRFISALKEDGFHQGYTLTPDGVDTSVMAAIREPARAELHLANWWRHVQWETAAIDMGVAFLWHPEMHRHSETIARIIRPTTLTIVPVRANMDPMRVREGL